MSCSNPRPLTPTCDGKSVRVCHDLAGEVDDVALLHLVRDSPASPVSWTQARSVSEVTDPEALVGRHRLHLHPRSRGVLPTWPASAVAGLPPPSASTLVSPATSLPAAEPPAPLVAVASVDALALAVAVGVGPRGGKSARGRRSRRRSRRRTRSQTAWSASRARLRGAPVAGCAGLGRGGARRGRAGVAVVVRPALRQQQGRQGDCEQASSSHSHHGASSVTVWSAGPGTAWLTGSPRDVRRDGAPGKGSHTPHAGSR
jgi:hypothetical protein